jgi:membrane-bound metal-dependent hydrolase YbcI (DUF457 family)
MRLATHASFGAFLTLGVASITELEITPASLGLAVLASTLPELDSESSEIGTLFPFLSKRIARRYGHRTFTHSFVGLGLFGLLVGPLWLFGLGELWWSLFLGYGSHILLDVLTPKGVCWFWPSLVPAGFGEARIKAGSVGESLLLVTFIALSFLIYPLSNVGALGALRSAIGEIDATFEEYRHLVGRGEAVALAGELQENRTKEILRGSWPIVDLRGEGYLVRVGPALRTVGKGPEYDLYPLSVHLEALSSSMSDRPSADGSALSAKSFVPLRFEVASAADLKVEEGQPIEVGELLGFRRPDPGAATVEELLESREVRSPVSGVIRRLELQAGEEGLRVEALVEVSKASDRLGLAAAADGHGQDQRQPVEPPAPAAAPAPVAAAEVCPCAVYFTPGDGAERALLRLIDSAEASIRVALYYFTDRELAQALLRAFARGVEVRVLLDEEQRTAKYSKSRYLAERGVEVRFFEGPGIFHHKFAVFDSRVVATGSYNWTASAQKQNEENLIVIEDDEIARLYEEEWRKLWGRSVR